MLFETICVQNLKPRHLAYHLNRMQKSCGKKLEFDLKSSLKAAIARQIASHAKHKAKLIYTKNAELVDIEILPYKPKQIKSIRLIDASISYDKKWLDRTQIDLLYKQKGSCDEILIVKDGFLSDTSIANIALLKNGKWLTPKAPLLGGTTRQRLLDSGFIAKASLKPTDLFNATAFATLNAMIGFRVIRGVKFKLD